MQPDFNPEYQPQNETAAAMPTNRTQSILIPIAIVFGFALVAAAIFFSGGRSAPQNVAVNTPPTNQVQPTDSGSPEAVNPVTEDDWIRGNPNAPIQIVEYSDYDCPFCKNFHESMNQIIDEYGPTGEVAWVYRHFPLEQLHPNAPTIALAAECVGALGGNESFWTFSDLVFDERATNEPTNITRLEEFAVSSGVSGTDFTSCLEEQRYINEVETDFNNAIAVGGRGTPHSIIIVGDQTGVINGAQPYSFVKQSVDNLLAQIAGGQ